MTFDLILQKKIFRSRFSDKTSVFFKNATFREKYYCSYHLTSYITIFIGALSWRNVFFTVFGTRYGRKTQLGLVVAT